MKKIGNWLLCVTPVLMVLAVQIVVSMFYSIAYMIIMRRPVTDLVPILTAAHFVNAVIAFCWYYFGFGKNGIKNPTRVFSAKTWGAVIALALGLQSMTQFVFIILSKVTPELMEDYAEMIKQSGIGELSFLSSIATLILAPIGEELVFRGLTYNYLKRAGAGIVVANIIQALLFGMMHVQPLQVAYALVLGLVLGYLGEKYKSVYVPMAMHCIFNFLGTYGISLFEDMKQTILLGLGFLTAAIISTVLGIIAVKKDKKIKQEEAVSE